MAISRIMYGAAIIVQAEFVKLKYKYKWIKNIHKEYNFFFVYYSNLFISFVESLEKCVMQNWSAGSYHI